MKIFVV